VTTSPSARATRPTYRLGGPPGGDDGGVTVG
jgi:hypothetical protein